MGALKYRPGNLAKLYFKDEKDQDLHDKKLIEALRQRLNERLLEPKEAQKAALILESWIHKKPR